MKMKICSLCTEKLDIEEFSYDKKGRDGRAFYCKKCNSLKCKQYRNRNLITLRIKGQIKKCRLNGNALSVDDVKKMLIAQNNRCAICKREENVVRQGKIMSLALDHSHETGQVRGMLCCKCNRAIGLMLDDPDLLIEAARYLRSFGGAKQ